MMSARSQPKAEEVSGPHNGSKQAQHGGEAGPENVGQKKT